MGVSTAYWQARGYAFKLAPDHYVDLVHDAYVLWFNKKGRNLFEEHKGVISQVVKNVWRGELMFKSYTWRGIKYPKQYISLTPTIDQEVNPYSPITNENPEKILISNELQEQLRSNLNKNQKELLNYLVLGYSTQEVAEELGTYRQKLDHTRKFIENKALKLTTNEKDSNNR